MKCGGPGIPLHPELNSYLGWGEVRLCEVEQELCLAGEVQDKVPVNMTLLTVWDMDQPAGEIQ